MTVNWAGNDDAGGSGIASYDVYVSDNGAASTLRDHTTDASATYTGVNGHTYAFFSVARDHVGNTQALPATGPTSTVVDTVLPAVATVLSRKAHGGAGTFDLPFAVYRFGRA